MHPLFCSLRGVGGFEACTWVCSGLCSAFWAELMSDLLGLGYLESRICSTISMGFSRSGLLSLNPRIAKHARQPDGSSMCLLDFCDRDIAATAGC